MDGNLEYILMPEGRILVEGTTYKYEYHLKDHLGNTRTVFVDLDNDGDIETASGEVTQVADYYPFGMKHANASLPNDATQKFLYNGKELQEGTDWYAYGARMYDPSIGRWLVIDPLAEWDYKTSPYVYVGNNPINYIDPDGMLLSKADRERRRQAKQDAKKNGGEFHQWRGHGKNRGYRYWSVTYPLSNEAGIKAIHDCAKNYDQFIGATLTGDKAGPIPPLSTAMHWLGSIDIHDLLTILGAINRSPELPKVNEVNPAKELKRIYSITEEIKQATSHDGQTTSDKDINPNNTNTRGQEIDENGQPKNEPHIISGGKDSSKFRSEDYGYGTRYDYGYPGDTLEWDEKRQGFIRKPGPNSKK